MHDVVDQVVCPGHAGRLGDRPYAQGGSWQMGACGPPGDHVWCEGSYDGAAFNEGWDVFSNPWT